MKVDELIASGMLKPCTEEDKKVMEDYFAKSKEAEESLDEIDGLIPYTKFIENTDEFKQSVPYWIGWDIYGYDEIKNSIGNGDIDEGIKTILKTNTLDYQTDGKTYRIINV